jgi:hypothetical protein
LNPQKQRRSEWTDVAGEAASAFAREKTLLRAFESVRFHDFQIVRFLLPHANCRRA